MADRSRPIFGDDAFKQLDAINDLPDESAGIGGVLTQDGNFGVTGHASKDIGKKGGWSVGALGEWTRKTGGKLAGMFTWKGGR